MSSSPVSGFTGISTFAPDLQNAFNRAVAIASLPIQQLTSAKNRFDGQAAELGQLGNLFTSLQTAIQSLASSGSGSNALAAAVSDPSVLQAHLTAGALAGTYTIQVLDPGSTSSALSNPGSSPVTDPSSQNISSSSTFTLSVGGTDYNIQPASQTLNALAQSINASGAPIQATVINLGSPGQPDYRLALQSTNLGNVSIQLNDGSSDLLSSVTTGTNASYTVNGQPSGGISSNSRTVTIGPGLTVNLQAAGTTDVTVAPSSTALSNSLTSFVNAYDAIVAELQKNRGQAGGALTGDSTLITLQESLRQLVNYSGPSGSFTSLTQLGIEFTQQGTLTFNSSVVSNLSPDQVNQALSFLGDPLSSGFLKSATDNLNALMDPISGLLPGELQSVEQQSQHEAQAISDAQDRVNLLQTRLQAQLAAADALIATLQQQTQFIQGLFNIPKLNSNGTVGNNNG
ncbi:MAG TPA: flagellar filament capping protein FliD [Bryobacteraceae bacterium]|nr:flagellar filament capping protein FliD [Bryobacteraceae bacterium]